MDTLFKKREEVVYYSQRDNISIGPSNAYTQCFPTSVAMAIVNNKVNDTLKRFAIDDVITALSFTDKVGRLAAQQNKIPFNNNTPLNQYWAVMAEVVMYFLGNRSCVKWSTGETLSSIKAEIDKGYCVVLGTQLAKLVGAGGHIVVAAGYTDSNDLIVLDPYGNPNNNYTDTNGNMVTIDKKLSPLLISGTPYMAMYIHADLK